MQCRRCQQGTERDLTQSLSLSGGRRLCCRPPTRRRRGGCSVCLFGLCVKSGEKLRVPSHRSVLHEGGSLATCRRRFATRARSFLWAGAGGSDWPRAVGNPTDVSDVWPLSVGLRRKKDMILDCRGQSRPKEMLLSAAPLRTPSLSHLGRGTEGVVGCSRHRPRTGAAVLDRSNEHPCKLESQHGHSSRALIAATAPTFLRVSRVDQRRGRCCVVLRSWC